MKKQFLILFLLSICIIPAHSNVPCNSIFSGLDTIPYKFYPHLNDEKPELPSPYIDDSGKEFVVGINKKEQYVIIPVTLHNERGICKNQLYIDTLDFPTLAKNGLHDEMLLNRMKHITDWPLDTITKLGRPGGLSNAGFMATDENIRAVLQADNNIVKDLELKHAQLAKPLFHVLNMMDEDLKIDRWNMAIHEWDYISSFFYNNQQIFVQAFDTKGGQKSIFNDGLKGAFHIKLWRYLSAEESLFLKNKYGQLDQTQFEDMIDKLTFINTGEMQPQYIMRYGFYEGHTFWRVDPIAISFIFGMRTLAEIEDAFTGQLNHKLTGHFK